MICPYCQQETGHYAKHAWPDGCAKAVLHPAPPSASQRRGSPFTELLNRRISSLVDSFSQLDLRTRQLRSTVSLFEGLDESPLRTNRQPMWSRVTDRTEDYHDSLPGPEIQRLTYIVNRFNAAQARHHRTGWSLVINPHHTIRSFDMTLAYNAPDNRTWYAECQFTEELVSSLSSSQLIAFVRDRVNHLRNRIIQDRRVEGFNPDMVMRTW